MPMIDMKAHIQPSEGSVHWWKALNRSIHQPDLQAFASPALTIRIACGDESFSCWRFLISNPILNNLLESPPCCGTEEKLVVLDSKFDLLPFMLLKQYLASGKLKITNTKVTAECFRQLQDMMSWICPEMIQKETSNSKMSERGNTVTKMKISGIESLETLNFSAVENIENIEALKVEHFDEQSNNNMDEDLNESSSKSSNPKKLMKCEICGWSKRYLPKHAWRFKEHVKMCKKKFEVEESGIDGEEDEVVVKADEEEIGEKVLECILCSKAHRNPSALRHHMTISHFYKDIKDQFVVPTGEHKNQVKHCVECDYKAAVVSSLIIHYGTKHNKLQEVAPQEVLDSIPSKPKARKQRKIRTASSSTPKSGSSSSLSPAVIEEKGESDTTRIFKNENKGREAEN